MRTQLSILIFSLFLLALSPLVLGQATSDTTPPTTSNSTTVSPNSTIASGCPNKCSGRGQCQPGPRCQCINGYYGNACQLSVADAIPTEFALTRAFCCIGFFVILVLASLSLYHRRKKSPTNGLFNASRIIMIEIIILALANILMWSTDPFGFKKNIPFWLTRTFFIITFPLLSTIYCTVLFHWAEVYFTIAHRIKKETALSKINKNYNPNVTLEGVLDSMRFINRIKIPFIVLIVFEWLMMIIRECLLQTAVIGTGAGSNGAWVQYLWLWYFTFVYGVECAGFFFWGPRLVKSMPEALQHKMRRVTRLIQAASLAFFFCWLPVAVISTVPAGRTPYAFLGADWTLRAGAMIVSSFVLSIFVQVRREAPFFYFGGRTTKKSSGSDALENSAETGIERSESHRSMTAHIDMETISDPIPLESPIIEDENGTDGAV